MSSDRKLLFVSALSGALSVAIGAFGAHGMEGEPAQWLATGGHYLMVHAALAVAVALWSGAGKLGRASGWVALTGGLIFCLALTTLALTGIRIMGAVAPIGGSLMIAGWVMLAIRAARGTKS